MKEDPLSNEEKRDIQEQVISKEGKAGEPLCHETMLTGWP